MSVLDEALDIARDAGYKLQWASARLVPGPVAGAPTRLVVRVELAPLNDQGYTLEAEGSSYIQAVKLALGTDR